MKRTRIHAPERRQQILAVATRLFAARGFHGTTTRQIAAAVGIKEVILFRLFPTKQDLYWAVIEHCMASPPPADLWRQALTNDTDDAILFRRLAATMLERSAHDPTLTRLLFFSALEAHELSHRFAQTYVADFYAPLTDYIRARIRAGKFRSVDPLLATRAFFGMVFQYGLACQLFGVKPEPKKAAATFADLWLNGIRVSPQR